MITYMAVKEAQRGSAQIGTSTCSHLSRSELKQLSRLQHDGSSPLLLIPSPSPLPCGICPADPCIRSFVAWQRGPLTPSRSHRRMHRLSNMPPPMCLRIQEPCAGSMQLIFSHTPVPLRDLEPLSLEDVFQPVQRQIVGKLAGHDIGQQPRSG